MNAAVKVIDNLTWRYLLPWRLRVMGLKGLCLLTLIVALFATSFAVVYEKDLHRRLFIQSQSMLTKQHALTVTHSNLVLEKNTLASATRIQAIASKQLGMHFPTKRTTTLLTA